MANTMSDEGSALLDDILSIKAGAVTKTWTPEQLLALSVRKQLKKSQLCKSTIDYESRSQFTSLKTRFVAEILPYLSEIIICTPSDNIKNKKKRIAFKHNNYAFWWDKVIRLEIEAIWKQAVDIHDGVAKEYILPKAAELAKSDEFKDIMNNKNHDTPSERMKAWRDGCRRALKNLTIQNK